MTFGLLKSNVLSPLIPEFVAFLTRIMLELHLFSISTIFDNFPLLDEASAEYSVLLFIDVFFFMF